MAQFQVEALPVEPFERLFSLNDEELQALNVKRVVANAKPGYPCRISLEDAEVGESVLLLKYDHLKAGGFYDASGPIFLRERTKPRVLAPGVLPPVVTGTRLFSIRVYDASAWMIEALVESGAELKHAIERAYEDPNASFVDVHNARPGCFAFRTWRCDDPPAERT